MYLVPSYVSYSIFKMTAQLRLKYTFQFQKVSLKTNITVRCNSSCISNSGAM